MIVLQLAFENFISVKNYITLQENFKQKDYSDSTFINNIGYSEIQEDIIIYQPNVDPNTPMEQIKDGYIKISFSDTLKHNINRMADNLIDRFIFKIEDANYHSKEQKANLAEHEFSKLHGYDKAITEADFLKTDIKTAVLKQLERYIEYLSRNISKTVTDETKLKIKMSKTDLMYLFLKLREGGLLDKRYSEDYAQLGKFIDNHFLFFNEREEEYSTIKKSRSDLHKMLEGEKNTFNSFNKFRDLFHTREF